MGIGVRTGPDSFEMMQNSKTAEWNNSSDLENLKKIGQKIRENRPQKTY